MSIGSSVLGTRRLAFIAAVDAIAERRSELHRKVAFGLDEPRQTAVGVDHSWLDDGIGRAGGDAPPARPATVVDRFSRRWRERRVGDDRAEYEPRAAPGKQEIGVLAEPADPSSMRGSTVDERVVVARHDCIEPGPTEMTGLIGQHSTQRRVVISPGVASNTPGRSGRRRVGRRLGIRESRHDETARSGNSRRWIRRTVGVAIGEGHPGVKPGVATPSQFDARSDERLSVGDAHSVDAGGRGHVDDFASEEIDRGGGADHPSILPEERVGSATEGETSTLAGLGRVRSLRGVTGIRRSGGAGRQRSLACRCLGRRDIRADRQSRTV